MLRGRQTQKKKREEEGKTHFAVDPLPLVHLVRTEGHKLLVTVLNSNITSHYIQFVKST